VAEGLLYVYGIVRRGSSVDGLVGLDGRPVEGVAHGGLTAVVSPISGDRLPDDIALLEADIRAHETVLERLLADATVLPMRFGTVIPSWARVAELLGRRQDDLLASLGRVEGKVEWGLNVTWDARAARSQVEAGTRALAGAGQSGGPGTAYLLTQRRKKTVGDEVERARLRVASALHDGVAALTAAASVHPSRHHRTAVLSASYLVSRSAEEAFRAGVARQLVRLEDSNGFRLAAELSGPWPPYNFVGAMA
jgi:hypothetical protein